MALEDNRVITNPDLIAANNPNYGVGQVKPKVPNLFAKPLTPEQKASMTYSEQDLANVSQQAVPSGSSHENISHAAGGNVTTVPPAKPNFEITRDHQGNYYTNGEKTPMTVLNPNAVPYRDTQSRPQITSMDELAAAMGYTSPEEEARLRKASVNNQRILAVADALRHIGNIANTANYAPSQQFNRPWAEEQARYEHGKAMRDKANNALFAYQRQRAEQERKIRQAEAEAARKERQMAFEREKWETQKPYYEQRGKAQEYIAGTKKLEYENAPDLIAGRKKAQDALAYQRKSSGDAAMVKANAYASDKADASRKRGYSGGSNGGGRRGGSGGSAPIRFSGRNGSYARKQNASKNEIDDMYQDAVNRGYVDARNQQMVADKKQTKAQVINKVATYVKDSDKFFDRHGYTKVRSEDKPAKRAAKTAAKPVVKGGNGRGGGQKSNKSGFFNS